MKNMVQVNPNSVGKQKAPIKKKKEKYIEILHRDNCSLASMNCLLFQIILNIRRRRRKKKENNLFGGVPLMYFI